MVFKHSNFQAMALDASFVKVHFGVCPHRRYSFDERFMLGPEKFW